MEDEQWSFLKCCYCSLIINEPRTLDCGHSYCLKCIKEMTNVQYEWANVILKCCICKFDNNFVIKTLISEVDEVLEGSLKARSIWNSLSSNEDIICSLCEEDSSETMCITCIEYHCRRCAKGHYKKNAEHKTYSINDPELTPKIIQNPLTGKEEDSQMNDWIKSLEEVHKFDNTLSTELNAQLIRINDDIPKIEEFIETQKKKIISKIEEVTQDVKEKVLTAYQKVKTSTGCLITDTENNALASISSVKYLKLVRERASFKERTSRTVQIRRMVIPKENNKTKYDKKIEFIKSFHKIIEHNVTDFFNSVHQKNSIKILPPIPDMDSMLDMNQSPKTPINNNREVPSGSALSALGSYLIPVNPNTFIIKWMLTNNTPAPRNFAENKSIVEVHRDNELLPIQTTEIQIPPDALDQTEYVTLFRFATDISSNSKEYVQAKVLLTDLHVSGSSFLTKIYNPTPSSLFKSGHCIYSTIINNFSSKPDLFMTTLVPGIPDKFHLECLYQGILALLDKSSWVLYIMDRYGSIMLSINMKKNKAFTSSQIRNISFTQYKSELFFLIGNDYLYIITLDQQANKVLELPISAYNIIRITPLVAEEEVKGLVMLASGGTNVRTLFFTDKTRHEFTVKDSFLKNSAMMEDLCTGKNDNSIVMCSRNSLHIFYIIDTGELLEYKVFEKLGDIVSRKSEDRNSKIEYIIKPIFNTDFILLCAVMPNSVFVKILNVKIINRENSPIMVYRSMELIRQGKAILPDITYDNYNDKALLILDGILHSLSTTS